MAQDNERDMNLNEENNENRNQNEKRKRRHNGEGYFHNPSMFISPRGTKHRRRNRNYWGAKWDYRPSLPARMLIDELVDVTGNDASFLIDTALCEFASRLFEDASNAERELLGEPIRAGIRTLKERCMDYTVNPRYLAAFNAVDEIFSCKNMEEYTIYSGEGNEQVAVRSYRNHIIGFQLAILEERRKRARERARGVLPKNEEGDKK